MEWDELYPKNVKPAYELFLEYFPDDIRELFLRFNQEMNDKYFVYNKWQRFEKNHGWVYGFCRNYRFELVSVIVKSDCFKVCGISVRDEKALEKVFEKTKIKYDSGYEQRYAEVCEKKKKNQIERSKKRVVQEKLQMEELTKQADNEMLNKFKWCKKVSRNDLERLYASEAKGLMDTELFEEIGSMFYIRCTQAREVRSFMEQGKLLCLNCGKVLQVRGYVVVEACECGYCYTYREYRRSCNAANMPGGRAVPVFDEFTEKWAKCGDSTQKMMLIDWLVHQCHVTMMSGIAGRSVGVNLIEGTKKQVSDLILKLAYK